MSMFRVGIYSVISTVARLMFSLAIVKIVAWQGGPEGVGKLGQFLSLVTIVVAFAGGGIGAGVIKYVSQYRNNDAERTRLLQSASAYTMLCAALAAVTLVLLSAPLALRLLGDVKYAWLIAALGLAQLLVAGHNLLVAILSGHMDARRVAAINIGGAVIGIAAAVALAYTYETDGALYSLVLGQSLLLLVSYPFYRKSPWFDRSVLRPRFDASVFRLLGRYSLMALTSAIMAPLVQLVVRNHLVDNYSWRDAGYWQAVSKLSEAYLLSITMVISMYYLPKLSATLDRRSLIAEIRSAFLFFIPAVTTTAIVIYVFRAEFTVLLFSREFLSSLNLYAPQLTSDVLKIASYILSYVMVAKAMTALFIASEVAFSVSYVILVVVLTDRYGLIGAMYASVVNYSAYFVFNVAVVRSYVNQLASSK